MALSNERAFIDYIRVTEYCVDAVTGKVRTEILLYQTLEAGVDR